MKKKMEEEEEEMTIRKGPWKAEEDEVLLNHVKKYGPRDWSSIRSKGLLQRTGKSCRLRWVNKLRPNLKNGCKFTAEEENTVIELQAQYGNKWARIATHLPGRTDNDVKNFWSSRQKRLARILQSHTASSSSSSLSSRPQKAMRKDTHVPVFKEVLSTTNLLDGESSSKAHSSSSSSITNVDISKAASLPNFPDCVCLGFGPNPVIPQFISLGNTSCNDLQISPFHFTSQTLAPELPLATMAQELLPLPDSSSLDSSFVDVLGQMDTCGLMELPGEDFQWYQGRIGSEKQVPPDSFFDDFPADVFDQMEPLPSPSKW